MPSVGQLVDPRHQPDRADGDAARGHAEPVGGRVGEAAYGADDRLVVGHRLAHAHEHDVGDATGSAGHLVARQRPGAGHDLLDDLGGGHVALQAALAGRAERAGHPAAGLAGDAHGHPVGVAHQHRLDERTVEEAATGSCASCRGRPPACAARSSGAAAARRRARHAAPRAGRSSRRGRRPAARSSASRAGARGSRAARAPRAAPCARPGVRSARCRGGLPRRGGSSKTSGRVFTGSVTTRRWSHPARTSYELVAIETGTYDVARPGK